MCIAHSLAGMNARMAEMGARHRCARVSIVGDSTSVGSKSKVTISDAHAERVEQCVRVGVDLDGLARVGRQLRRLEAVAGDQ